jgi:hypothetical protein
MLMKTGTYKGSKAPLMRSLPIPQKDAKWALQKLKLQ